MFKDIGGIPTDEPIGVACWFHQYNAAANYADAATAIRPLVIELIASGASAEGALGYNPTDGTWNIRTAAATWTSVLTKTIQQYTTLFVKLVIDFTTGKYVSLQVSEEDVDLSAHSLYTDTTATSDRMRISAYVTAAAGKTCALFIDEFRVTYRER